jgi:hypothetical protein
MSMAGGASLGAGAAVPEPASLALIFAGVPFLYSSAMTRDRSDGSSI